MSSTANPPMRPQLPHHTQKTGPGFEIFCGNLALTAGEAELHAVFKDYNVLNVYLPTRRGRPHKGLAFVKLPNAVVAQQAISKVSGTMIHGMPLEVAYIRPKIKVKKDKEVGSKSGTGEFPLRAWIKLDILIYWFGIWVPKTSPSTAALPTMLPLSHPPSPKTQPVPTVRLTKPPPKLVTTAPPTTTCPVWTEQLYLLPTDTTGPGFLT
ncbi:hypothetical protein GQ43DRAFT_433285 [Delitschia confertaspora ATCC 74209]|uniref:RRM domain-containing protein n=1 Tax=Delitschia confertaspora ATCC 74209 TaxID=1513339 RepID=A0A9P4JHM2_9PLEO|nr:hypothetical protein GQ43DRAFT_433285 [Delitschia confertaspora ATCC 74209]